MTTASPSPKNSKTGPAGGQARSSPSPSSTTTSSSFSSSAPRPAKPHRVYALPLDQIEPPDVQMRDAIDPQKLRDLADSMRTRGLIQPIRVRSSNGHYKIVAGHRRYLAAQMLGWFTIDAIPLTDAPSADLATSLHENLFRDDLTPLEEAALIAHLTETEQMSLEAVARALNHSREWAEGRAALLAYPAPLQQAIHAGTVPLSAAPYLAQIHDPDQLASALDAARTHGMTMRAAMEWARQAELYAQAQAAGTPAEAPSYDLAIAEASKTYCDLCTAHVYINVTKILRVCFDCLRAASQGLKPT